MLMRKVESIALPKWNCVWLMPNEIIAQYPMFLLHADCEPGRDQEELLLRSEAAHRCLAALSGFVAHSLSAVIPNAAPPGKVGINDIDPHAAIGLQTSECALEDFRQMGDVPFRVRFQSEDAAFGAVPAITAALWTDSSYTLDVVKEIPVMVEAIVAMAPIRGTRDDQVD